LGQSQTEYQSYMLRLWRSGQKEPWRGMLEAVDHSERHTFVDLEDLFAFLRSRTGLALGQNTSAEKWVTHCSQKPP
jgi:hypothetical protein